MRKSVLLIILVAVVAIGLGVALYLSGIGPSSASVSDAGPAAVIVPFAELTHGSQSQVQTRVNYILSSQAELDKLWKLLGTNDKVPTVDFKAKAVIAVFAGEKPTAGYDIGVSKIEDLSAKRLVTVTLIAPAAGCPAAEMITAPYEILTVPVTSLPLDHEDTTKTVGCTD